MIGAEKVSGFGRRPPSDFVVPNSSIEPGETAEMVEKSPCAPFFTRPQWKGKDTNRYGLQIAETSLDRNRLARIRCGYLPAASTEFRARSKNRHPASRARLAVERSFWSPAEALSNLYRTRE